MTNEEAASLKVGDEVLVRRKITALQDNDGEFHVSRPRGYASYASADEIHSLALPRPLEVGDWVAAIGWFSAGQIKAIDGDYAWVVGEAVSHETRPLRGLTRTDAPE